MTSRGSKSAYWDFVFNNWDSCPSETGEIDKKKIWNQMIRIFSSDIYEDCCFEAEVGESGTPHLQGWLKLNKRQYKSYLLRSALNMDNLEDKISFRIVRNIQAVKKYCVKEGGEYYSKTGLSVQKLRGIKTIDEILKALPEITEEERTRLNEEYFGNSKYYIAYKDDEATESEGEYDHEIGPNTSIPDYGLSEELKKMLS